MTHSMLTINISEQYKLHCIVTDENDDYHIIKLDYQKNDSIPIRIAFDMNEIIIGKKKSNSVSFMKAWIDYPQIFKEYIIEYQREHIV